MNRAERLFRRFRTPIILVFRFFYGIRAVLVFVIGMSRIPAGKFAVLNALGAAIWPLSAAGRLRLARDEAHCTACGACDRACPQVIDVSRVQVIRSGECTLCLECTAACPSAGALELRWVGVKR